MPVSTRKHLEALREADQRAVDAALTAAKEAVETAKTASDDHLKANNNVLEGWKADRGTFATKEELGRIASFQSKLLGGIGVVAFIGLANLAKIWLT
jgi:hypothetical protein